MSEHAVDYDVLIGGSGLVGLALARALANDGLSVAVADRSSPTVPDVAPDDDDWDARVYAISPGSAAFLRAQGAWQRLPPERLASVESMRVEGDAGAVLNFSAYDLGERALAWIVEERALRAALVPLVRTSRVDVLAPRVFDSMFVSSDAVTLRFADGDCVSAKLVVGADGARSWVREAAGLAATMTSYAQTAVVANFACEREHRGRAYQWFFADGGVLAWLPLPGRRVSIVWSASEALAAELLAAAPEALAARARAAGRDVLGEFRCVTAPAAFPLQRVKLPATISRRVVLAGDAAHGIHPLAGQGVNLGFGDAEALAAVLRERGPLHDVGAPILLERYARRRAEPVAAMQMVTDSLARLFAMRSAWARSARNAGMTAVDRLPAAKRLLAQSALR